MMLIDVHGHSTPLAYIRALEQRDAYPRARADGDGYRIEVSERLTFRATSAHWDLSLRIPALDAAGVTRQAISLSAAYGFDLLEGGEAVMLAEATNEALLAGTAPFGGRLLPLAVAPVGADGDGLAVLKRALQRGHRGMILSSSTIVHLADDAILRPYLEQVRDAGGFALVHPGSRINTEGLPAFAYSVNTAGFQNELTVALFRLAFGGLLDAVSGVRVVFVNLGGAAPLLAERMRSMWENGNPAGEPPDLGFRRVWYDYSSFRQHSLEAAVAVLGADRIVLGTDYPIQGLERPIQTLREARISDADREAIDHGNVEGLLAGKAGAVSAP